MRTPALFVHGTRDPFGSPEELRNALELIPSVAELLTIEGTGHDLGAGAGDVAAAILDAFRAIHG